MAGRLSGRSALVTGAGSGIGRAVARLFAAEGARVAAVARRDEHLAQWSGVEGVVPLRADLTRPAEIDAMVDEAYERVGDLDIICNIAGVHDRVTPLDETTDDMWDLVVDTDLKAPFLITRRAITRMVGHGGGVILHYGSIASVRGLHGPSYNAAKAGLIGLTTSTAVRYGGAGVRCNLLQSGGVRDTSIGATSGGSNHVDGMRMFRAITDGYPVEWTCDPEEMAEIVLFFCSDAARHINGAVIPVDGGMSAC